jgi:parvulin-like peptidyl-prolyl isomerase
MSLLHIKFHEKILNSSEAYDDLKEAYAFQKRLLEGLPLSERYGRLVQIHEQIHPKIAKDVEKMTQNYIQKLRREASITKYYERLNVQVTEEELKDFYQRHIDGLHGDEYRVSERARIHQIVIKVDKESEGCSNCGAENKQKAKEQATSALLELRSGADFRTVSQKYSTESSDSSLPKWIARGSREKLIEESIFSLEIGEISGVFEENDTFYIIKLLEKQPGRFKSFKEVLQPLEREYRWQKGEEYLKASRDRILFTIDGRPYTTGDFLNEYTRYSPPHQCHHEKGEHQPESKKDDPQLCDFSHNNFEDQKMLVDRMIDKELITEDTYNQMIHVEHQKEIEFVTMASLYPIFHQEEMKDLVHISNERIKEYYQKEKKNYRYPAKAKLNMLVVKGGDTEEDKKKAFEKAQTAYKELNPSFFSFNKQKDFAEVARKYSEDAETASKGGRLDVDVYECRNAIEYMVMHGFHEEIFALKPGDISDIFEFENDYYIVQIREMESRKQLNFEDIREKVKKDLYTKEHEGIMESWEDNLLKSAGFVIYGRPLQEMLAETKTPENIEGS